MAWVGTAQRSPPGPGEGPRARAELPVGAGARGRGPSSPFRLRPDRPVRRQAPLGTIGPSREPFHWPLRTPDAQIGQRAAQTEPLRGGTSFPTVASGVWRRRGRLRRLASPTRQVSCLDCHPASGNLAPCWRGSQVARLTPQRPRRPRGPTEPLARTQSPIVVSKPGSTSSTGPPLKRADTLSMVAARSKPI